jgi:hypothetical protein
MFHLKPCALSVPIRCGVDGAVVERGGDGRILEAGLGHYMNRVINRAGISSVNSQAGESVWVLDTMISLKVNRLERFSPQS